MLTIDLLNSIIDEKKCDLVKCVSDEDMYATFSVGEMVELIPKIKKMAESKALVEFLAAAELDEDDFVCEFLLTPDELTRMKKEMTEAEKRVFIFAVIQKNIADKRYHTCQSCGRDFYTTDEDEDFCDHCKNFYGLR